MPIQYPETRQIIFDRVATDIQAELPESEPFLRDHFFLALAIGYCGALYDAYKTIQELQKQMFTDTATGEFADRWASFKDIFRLPATQSAGLITITGNAGVSIPINTQLQAGDGKRFLTQDTYTIVAQTINVLSMARSGGLVTVTTVSDHHFATNNLVTHAGAVETAYNGTRKIVVTGSNTYTFEITSTPTTPATGTITATQNYVSALVKSIDFGATANFDAGSELFFSSPIAGVNSSSFVQYGGLTGGVDAESNDAFKKRYLYIYKNPRTYWNVSDLVSRCQEINGVTRVFVEENNPDPGKFKIYFMRDNDVNPIPSGTQVAIVRAKLEVSRPAYMKPTNVVVLAPTPKVINFKFSVLDPNTDTMRNAIIASLQAFFSEVPIVSENLSKNSYASAIYSTVDPSTGQFVKNFVLAYPLGDILVADGEIATLGTINF